MYRASCLRLRCARVDIPPPGSRCSPLSCAPLFSARLWNQPDRIKEQDCLRGRHVKRQGREHPLSCGCYFLHATSAAHGTSEAGMRCAGAAVRLAAKEKLSLARPCWKLGTFFSPPSFGVCRTFWEESKGRSSGHRRAFLGAGPDPLASISGSGSTTLPG